ncbi:HTTM domain-containing protein [Spongiimicrobium salis]|uniref:HTTM domain-containing protein n=1 Tax=Spongiimicrobium salis TaxID=1667022 RepID=UPI00374DA1B8
MVSRFLFQKIDNSSLVLFRVFFGILIALECYGAIVTGWVRRTLVEPKFTFNFIGFEWLQPLPGNGMYYYFLVMGTLGVLIALGYKYRYSMIGFTLLWAGVYFMQKTSYNNHYYLLLLISFLMIFLPADRDISWVTKKNPALKTHSMYGYVKWIIIAQLFIVYVYASVAKVYGDWLDFRVIELLMKGRADYPLVGSFLQLPWVHKVIGITGIVFDLLIIPALLWKPSRKIAFGLAIIFHLFNSFVLQIGIFPYLALAFTVFFFEPKTIRKLFFKRKEIFPTQEAPPPNTKRLLFVVTGLYFIIQLGLPVRHHFIQDDVLWTEEGHRLSWRMMLRSRTGRVQFKVVDPKTKATDVVNLDTYLTKKQQRRVAAYPDFMWQFAQHLKKEYAAKGKTIEVYVKSRVSINGKPYRQYIDPEVDIANVPWNHFGHHDWILPSPL